MNSQPGPRKSEESVRPTGAAAAAVLAVGTAILALGGANLVVVAYQPFDEALAVASRLFIPGGAFLTAYGGKELVALIAWLGSWGLLHRRLQHRQVDLTAAAGVFLVCLVVGTLLLWPPLVHALVRLAR